MFYIIYKTTNKINNKIYIGKHQTKTLDDGYLGSGKLLKAAIRKYGVENFEREVLFIFDTKVEMNEKEAELVTEDFCELNTNYNLCVGGRGGFSYINRNSLGVPNMTKETSALWAPKAAERKRELLLTDPHWTKEYKAKISKGLRIRYESGAVGTFKGKTHSEKTKQLMSDIRRGNNTGAQNSQFGTCWVYNDTGNKKIPKVELESYLNMGFTKGRRLN